MDFNKSVLESVVETERIKNHFIKNENGENGEKSFYIKEEQSNSFAGKRKALYFE